MGDMGGAGDNDCGPGWVLVAGASPSGGTVKLTDVRALLCPWSSGRGDLSRAEGRGARVSDAAPPWLWSGSENGAGTSTPPSASTARRRALPDRLNGEGVVPSETGAAAGGSTGAAASIPAAATVMAVGDVAPGRRLRAATVVAAADEAACAATAAAIASGSVALNRRPVDANGVSTAGAGTCPTGSATDMGRRRGCAPPVSMRLNASADEVADVGAGAAAGADAPPPPESRESDTCAPPLPPVASEGRAVSAAMLDGTYDAGFVAAARLATAAPSPNALESAASMALSLRASPSAVTSALVSVARVVDNAAAAVPAREGTGAGAGLSMPNRGMSAPEKSSSERERPLSMGACPPLSLMPLALSSVMFT